MVSPAARAGATAALFGLLAGLVAGPAAGRTVVDMSGRQVEVPDRVERVACLEVLCYPRMLMLGARDKVAMMYDTTAPWMAAVDPEVAAIPKLAGDPDIEELLARKVDVAFFLYNAAPVLAKLSDAGIPALIAQPLGRQPASADAFAADAKAMVRLFGQVLGGEAEQRAEDWCAWFDEKRRYVAARLAAPPALRRRRLFYVRGPQAISTQGRNSYTYWLGELAGAEMVVGQAAQGGRALVSMEDILRWDPEVVVVGRQYPPGLVLDDPRWRNVAAVRGGDVHPSPAGVFYWDGGPESVLLMLYLAKLLYPERFGDLDMVAEVQGYYARFYRHALTEAEATRLLQGVGPDGRRFNPRND